MASESTKAPSVKPSSKDWPHLPEVLIDNKNKRSYKRGNFLGEGGFAKCYEAFDIETNDRRCCKAIWKKAIKSDNEKEKIRSEIKINSALKHNRIVTLYSCFEDENYVYIILEMCDKQSMMDLLRRRKYLTEEETRYYMLQILDAMEYCLSKRVIHRDLKLGNVFITSDMTIRVGDFGLATQLTEFEDRKKTICGTPNYIAPEVLFDRGGHSFEADMWSIGVIIYTLIIGIPPFQTSNTKKLYSKIKTCDYSFPSNRKISDDAKDLIQKMLTSNPDERPKFDEIRKHPFFANGYTPDSLPQSALLSKPVFNFIPESSSKYSKPVSDEILSKLKGLDVTDSDPPTTKKSRTNKPAIGKSNFSSESFQPVSSEPSTPEEEIASNGLGAPVKGVVHSLPVPISPTSIKIPSVSPETQIFEEIVKTFEKVFTLVMENRPLEKLESELNRLRPICPNFISKWVDQGDQYGLGFELIDTTSGIFFKDSTSMIAAPDGNNIEYLYYPPGNDKNSITCDFYNTSNLPSSLQKKYRVLKQYTRYMSERLSSAVATSVREVCLPTNLTSPSNYTVSAGLTTAQLPYVTKFLRTRRATLFRLSNRVVQMNFKSNHVKLIVSEKGHLITVITNDGYLETRRLIDIIKDLKRLGRQQQGKTFETPAGPGQSDASSSPNLPEHDRNKINPSQSSITPSEVCDHIEYLRDVLKHILSKKQPSKP